MKIFWVLDGILSLWGGCYLTYYPFPVNSLMHKVMQAIFGSFLTDTERGSVGLVKSEVTHHENKNLTACKPPETHFPNLVAAFLGNFSIIFA